MNWYNEVPYAWLWLAGMACATGSVILSVIMAVSAFRQGRRARPWKHNPIPHYTRKPPARLGGVCPNRKETGGSMTSNSPPSLPMA